VRVVVSKVANRALRRAHKRALIVQKIEELAHDPEALRPNVKRLRGRPGFRLRIQDWRVLFRIEDGTLFIDEIEPRGSAYEDRK